MASRKKTEISFESALKELDEVVQTLEGSQVDLDEHLKLYEKGVRLIQFCQTSLKDAEKKIELLAGLKEDGSPKLEEFGHQSAMEKEEKGLFTVED